MLLSTAIPIVIAAIVMVIMSKGIPNNPIIPNIKKAAIKLISLASLILRKYTVYNNIKYIYNVLRFLRKSFEKIPVHILISYHKDVHNGLC